MRQWTGSALVQVTACRQFGTLPSIQITQQIVIVVRITDEPIYNRLTRGRSGGRLRVRIRSIEKSEVGNFTLLHKISRTACCFGISTLLKQYNCYESATIWYTDHQYLAQLMPPALYDELSTAANRVICFLQNKSRQMQQNNTPHFFMLLYMWSPDWIF